MAARRREESRGSSADSSPRRSRARARRPRRRLRPRAGRPGGVVVVTGEPGVGKSRLTEGARQHARHMGFRWLQTRCLSYGASLAYWPYAELVRRMAGIQPDTASEEAVALLRATVGLGGSTPFFVRLLGLPAAGEGDVEALEPEAFRRGLHDAFATLLSSLAAESPLVVAVEDLHWADASTLELTRELTGLCEERPLVLYVTARPESQSALEELPSQMVVQLDPLDEAGLRSSWRTCSTVPRRPGSCHGSSSGRQETRSSSRSSCARSSTEGSFSVPTATGSCRPDGRRATYHRRSRACWPPASTSFQDRRLRCCKRLR